MQLTSNIYILFSISTSTIHWSKRDRTTVYSKDLNKTNTDLLQKFLMTKIIYKRKKDLQKPVCNRTLQEVQN